MWRLINISSVRLATLVEQIARGHNFFPSPLHVEAMLIMSRMEDAVKIGRTLLDAVDERDKAA